MMKTMIWIPFYSVGKDVNEINEWAFECPDIKDRSRLAPWVQVIISTDDFWVLFDKKEEFNNRYGK